MREILVVSGKGGTGKTSFVACLAELSNNALFCDCDVDASNLHLLLAPEVQKTTQFYAGWLPKIDSNSCINCGKCYNICRSKAIDLSSGYATLISGMCEGCGVCADHCPVRAISLEPRHCGRYYKSQTTYGSLFHAELFPGEENSGKLIAELRREAKAEAIAQKVDCIISDGPPGIGCPVISAMSGVDLVILVTEPTPSGIHDLKRVAKLAHQFEIETKVVINKWDLNAKVSDEISRFCQEHDIEELGRVTYDGIFPKVLRAGKTVLSEPNSKVALEISEIFSKIDFKKGR